MPFFSTPGSGGGGIVDSIVPGPGIDVDSSDPAAPIVSATSKRIRVSSGDFIGNTYTNADLIGLTPEDDFDVIAGSFLNLTDDYTFNGVSGGVTLPSGPNDLLILIY